MHEPQQHQQWAVRRDEKQCVRSGAANRAAGNRAGEGADEEVQHSCELCHPPLRRDRQAVPRLLGRQGEREQVGKRVSQQAHRAGLPCVAAAVGGPRRRDNGLSCGVQVRPRGKSKNVRLLLWHCQEQRLIVCKSVCKTAS